MTNREIADFLEKIANILILQDANPFKIKAYQNAANSVYYLDGDIASYYADGRVDQISGVGKKVKAQIEELLTTGKLEYYEQLTAEVPESVVEMLNIPGIGPKTIRIIRQHLPVSNLSQLLAAARNNEIRKLPGLGGKTEYNIIKGMDMLSKAKDRANIGSAYPLAQELLLFCRSLYGVPQAEIVGSLRRGKPLVGDIDILLAANDFCSVIAKLQEYRGIKIITELETNRIAGELAYNTRFEVILVQPEYFAHSLLLTTGSHEFCQALPAHIVWTPAFYRDEAEIFDAIGWQFIPPELRETSEYIDLARQHLVPQLINGSDLKGDLHIHSNWSDGADTIEQMVAAAKKRGYTYMAFTEHSQSLPVSGGLNSRRLREQIAYIEEMNRSLSGFRILKGIEVDILKDGSLDLPAEILADLDIVIASVHSYFNLGKEEQSARLIAAIKNPFVHMIGHLTGRLLNRRPGYDLDMNAVLEAAAYHGKILEMNSHPDRLDIAAEVACQAQQRGIKIAINSDAHHKEDFSLIEYGITNARRACLQNEDVVNTWDDCRLLHYLQRNN